MHSRIMFILTAAFGLLGGVASAAENYKIDPAHTSLTLSVRPMGINSMKGYFDQFAGSVLLEDGQIKEAACTIQVPSINTGVKQRDDPLWSPDFFDAGMRIATAHTNIISASAQEIGAGFQDGYAHVNGVRLHYVKGGKGSLVMLVPGWPETWYAWRHVMPALAKKYTVVAVDTRGMGDSERPLSGYDMATIGRDLHELAQKLGYQRFRLVGHDIGVWIAYAMAADYPQALEQVVMLDSNIPGVTPSPPVFRPKEENTRSWHFMFNQLDDLPETLVSGKEREYLTWIYSNYAYKPQKVAIDEYVRAYSMPGAMRTGFAYYRALPETIKQNEKRMESRLTMPILALGGEFGTGDLARETLEPYADKLQGGVLPDCGHYVPEECHEALLERMLPFLEGSDQ